MPAIESIRLALGFLKKKKNERKRNTSSFFLNGKKRKTREKQIFYNVLSFTRRTNTIYMWLRNIRKWEKACSERKSDAETRCGIQLSFNKRFKARKIKSTLDNLFYLEIQCFWSVIIWKFNLVFWNRCYSFSAFHSALRRIKCDAHQHIRWRRVPKERSQHEPNST